MPGLCFKHRPGSQEEKPPLFRPIRIYPSRNTMKAQLQTRWFKAAFVSSSLLLSFVPGIEAANADRVLTTAAAVRNLSATEAAQKHPVKLRGVVTFHDEALFSRFLQDETAGIYLLELTNMPALSPGQLVEVEGTTGPGEYAPVVQPTSVKVVGAGTMPAARPVTLEQLVSGRHDSQLVEFSGIVRSVRLEKESQFYLLDFAKGSERFTAYVKQLPVAQPQDLVESIVKVRGVCATMFNHQRQLFGIRLLVPQADGLVIEKPASATPYDLAEQKINSLLQFAPDGNSGGRVKVRGTVVHSEPGNALFILDGKAGLYCKSLQRDALQPGDQVEVLGFPAKGEYTPVLEDASYRKTGSGTAPTAARVDVNEILTGIHDCQLVELPARVVDRVERGLNQFLLLQAGDFTFQAYLPPKVTAAELAGLQNGSEVIATGICMIERGNKWQAGDKWRAAAFHLVLRSAQDITVVQKPVVANLPDGLGLAVVFGVVALAALAWVAVLKIKMRRSARA